MCRAAFLAPAELPRHWQCWCAMVCSDCLASLGQQVVTAARALPAVLCGVLVDGGAEVAGLQRRCCRQSPEVDTAFDAGLHPVGAEGWGAVRQMRHPSQKQPVCCGLPAPSSCHEKATCETDNCRGRQFVCLHPPPKAFLISGIEMGTVPVLKRLGTCGLVLSEQRSPALLQEASGVWLSTTRKKSPHAGPALCIFQQDGVYFFITVQQSGRGEQASAGKTWAEFEP